MRLVAIGRRADPSAAVVERASQAAGRATGLTPSSPSAAPIPHPAPRLTGRRHELLPFIALGVTCVIVGGLVAAASASAPTEHATWAAAYLVLVGGVAQVGFALGHALLVTRTPVPMVAAQAAGWNLGNAAVLTGTLLGVSALVDLGGVLLIATLILLAHGLRPAGVRPAGGIYRWCLHCYRLLVLILLISIPVGLVLAHRASR